MGVLDDCTAPDPSDAEALAAAIARAAAKDWRAAAFLLEHDPQHRQTWGNREQLESVVHATLARVAAGISHSGLSPEQQEAVLLSIRATGAAAPLPG